MGNLRLWYVYFLDHSRHQICVVKSKTALSFWYCSLFDIALTYYFETWIFLSIDQSIWSDLIHSLGKVNNATKEKILKLRRVKQICQYPYVHLFYIPVMAALVNDIIGNQVWPKYNKILVFDISLNLLSTGERTGRHPPDLGQLQHRQQQPLYPLSDLEMETHLCLYTCMSGLYIGHISLKVMLVNLSCIPALWDWI